MKILGLYLVVYFTARCIRASTECEDAYECFGQTITENGTELVSCKGDHSCSQATIKSDYNIDCSAAFSCFKCTAITPLTANTVSTIECDGLYSCARIDNLNTTYRTLQCEAELSCYGSTITMGEGSELECSGDKSCANASITITGESSTTITVLGTRAAMDATFETSGNGVSYTFDFWGWSSGHNTTIICNAGDTCSINCDVNACDELNLQCNSDATCNIDCSHGQYSDVCGNGYMSYGIPDDFTNNKPPTLVDIEFTTLETSEVFCNDSDNDGVSPTGAYVVGDYYERINGYMYSNYSWYEQSVCCTGESSCNVEYLEIIGISSSDDDIAVRCDALRGCNQATIYAPNGGSVYLGGLLIYMSFLLSSFIYNPTIKKMATAVQ